VNAEVSY